MAQLIAWPYVPMGEDMFTSPGDDLIVLPAGTIDELYRAARRGLIDVDVCEAVFDAVYGRG
ncbi:hypothetical protein D9T14_10280 [Propionibacterium australiense]|nr:hypothetical protein D7U36_12305 [Propionibacterium australiense]RLP07496.1 hypothetical protein D9T14_10280 [Propionibacterium australiense]